MGKSTVVLLLDDRTLELATAEGGRSLAEPLGVDPSVPVKGL